MSLLIDTFLVPLNNSGRILDSFAKFASTLSGVQKLDNPVKL
jgi:hypothetical protein